MCGRYATARTPDTLTVDFAARLGDFAGDIEADYNVAPTKTPPLVVGRVDAEGGRMTREIATARWGLVPSWVTNPSIRGALINARSETVAQKPSFRTAFAKRRALVPADGYYEWFQPQDGPKVPFYICDPAGLALAGLYEFWRAAPGQAWLLTFTILTTRATGDDGRIHDRAPLLVGAGQWDDWLTPGPAADLLEELTPATPGRLQAWPVSTAVNNVRNNGPALIEPVAAE